MLTSYNYEAKTIDEAYKKCESEFNLDELYIKEDEIKTGLFKQKKYKLTIVLKDDIKKYIKDYINKLDESFKINILSEINEKENIFNINLTSENNPILIGKDGRIIEAIQNMIRNSLKNQLNMDIKINLDVSNYKKKKEANFEKEIKQIIKEVIETHVDVKLDPMNSYKRRLVHNIVANYKELKTESVGEEPLRYTIIKYKED